MDLDGNITLGRYRIQSRLGTGGMGEVYQAIAVGPDGVEKPVAVKLVRDDLLRNKELTALFIEEAKVSFVLTHPHVVQTYELGQVDQHHFLVMEHVEGTSLARVLYHCLEQVGQPVPLPFALYITSCVARGLDYAHTLTDGQGSALGIVHRDVSPSNVLISWSGQVKVADFGLAKSALRKMETQAGAIKGKLAYMAPEQFAGEEVDARGDVFSIGVMLYEMLAGQNPYGELHDVTVVSRASQELIAPLADAAPGLDPAVATLVDRCLAPNPEHRPQTAREVGRELDRVIREQRLAASDYELAEFISRLKEVEQAAKQKPHPFDRVLGMELERVAGQAAVSTFMAVPSSGDKGQALPAGFHQQQTLVGDDDTLPQPRPLLSEPSVETALLPAGAGFSRPGVWIAGVAILLAAAALAAWGLGWFGGATPDPPVVASTPDRGAPAVVQARPDAARPRSATLRLKPTPAGGKVLVDGKPRGTTPVTISELSAGQVRVQISTPGYHAYDEQVTLERGSTVILQPVLRPALRPKPPRKIRKPRVTSWGTLSVNSEPWSVVYVDGAKVGNTPLVRHRLTAGWHQVKLVNPGKKLRKVQGVTVVKDRDFRLSVKLGP